MPSIYRKDPNSVWSKNVALLTAAGMCAKYPPACGECCENIPIVESLEYLKRHDPDRTIKASFDAHALVCRKRSPEAYAQWESEFHQRGRS
jgi:hypothetical protein